MTVSEQEFGMLGFKTEWAERAGLDPSLIAMYPHNARDGKSMDTVDMETYLTEKKTTIWIVRMQKSIRSARHS